MIGGTSKVVSELFQRYPQLQRVLSNSGWIIVCGIANSLIALLAGILVARYLGPTELGAINYAMAIIAIVTSIANLGLDGIALREMSRHPENAAVIVLAGFLLRGIATLIVFSGITIATIYFTPPALQGREAFLLVLAVGLLAPPFASAAIFFDSNLRSVVPKLNLLGSGVLYMLAVVVGVRWQLAPMYFVVAMAARQVLSTIVTFLLFWTLKRRRTESSPEPSTSLSAASWQLLRDGWPQTFSSIALLIQAHCDQIMLGEIRDLDSVAQYGVSLKMTILLASFPQAIATSFSPSLARRFAADREKFWEGFHQVNRLSAILCIAIIVATMVVGPTLIGVAYGEEYALAGSLITLMVFRTALASIGSLRQIYLVNANILHYAMVSVIVGSLLNIALNFIMIPQYGTWGAVIASFISFAVTTIVLDLFFAKTRRAMLVSLSAWLVPFLNYERRLFRW